MNLAILIFDILLAVLVVVSGGTSWKEVHRGSGLKIGLAGNKNNTSVRGNGIKLGGSTRGVRLSTTSMAPEEDHIIHPPTVVTSQGDLIHLHAGMVVPYKAFGTREYNKAVNSAKYIVQRKLNFLKNFDINVHIMMKPMSPSPTGNIGTYVNISEFITSVSVASKSQQS